MFDFIKYKYFSISISWILIFAGFGITYGVHGGFANSLDFNGGIRTTIEFSPEITREKLNSYFADRKIEAVLIQLDKDKNVWQIDTNLSVLDNYILERKETNQVDGSPVQDFIASISKDFSIT
ncbi:MAG: protein translocase subunit SecF, partial [Leptospira sp.]|nr:protein translocase subunit SecF [Leptospira sp.]